MDESTKSAAKGVSEIQRAQAEKQLDPLREQLKAEENPEDGFKPGTYFYDLAHGLIDPKGNRLNRAERRKRGHRGPMEKPR